MSLEIVSFDEKYAKEFHDLNIEWLKTFFYVEPFDKEVLSKPKEHIIEKGGYIFFVIKDHQVSGTVALMPTTDKNMLELTKMAVAPIARDQKIGQQLLQHCIAFCRSNHYKSLILYSNTILENAIHLYRKYGFVELELERENPYKRSNIKMLLEL